MVTLWGSLQHQLYKSDAILRLEIASFSNFTLRIYSSLYLIKGIQLFRASF